MTDYGVVADGFVPKPYNVIIQEKQDRAIALFGDDVDLSATSPLQKLLEIQALEEQRLWEMCEAFYYSGFVDFATGESLDRVVAIIGLTRKSATRAVGTVTFTGVPATVIPAGSTVQTTPASGEDAIEFTTDALGTIGGGGTIDVAVTAVLPGVEGNVTGTNVNVLKVPIAGVTGVSNAAMMTGGTDVETDSAFRQRAKGQLTALAKGTLEAIRLAVLAVAGVVGVAAEEDLDIHVVTLYVDGKTPPDTDVSDAIEDTRPAGIPVNWFGVTAIDIYCDITVDVDSDLFPADGATQIKTGIVNYLTGLSSGDDVIYSKVIDAVYDVEEDESQNWIRDITSLKIGKVSPPTSASNIDIAKNEKSTSDVTKVNVTTTSV